MQWVIDQSQNKETPKIFDNFFADALSIQIKAIIPSHQHGFVKHRSMVVNLLMWFVSKLCLTIDLAKLNSMGLSEVLLKWFASFLKKRYQQVKIGNVTSSKARVTSSVTQGSHCGPILFSLYISDIVEELDVDYSIYADDLKIRSEINDVFDCIHLQSNIDRLRQYAKNIGLSLNIVKCTTVRFTPKHSSKI